MRSGGLFPEDLETVRAMVEIAKRHSISRQTLYCALDGTGVYAK